MISAFFFFATWIVVCLYISSLWSSYLVVQPGLCRKTRRQVFSRHGSNGVQYRIVSRMMETEWQRDYMLSLECSYLSLLTKKTFSGLCPGLNQIELYNHRWLLTAHQPVQLKPSSAEVATAQQPLHYLRKAKIVDMLQRSQKGLEEVSDQSLIIQLKSVASLSFEHAATDFGCDEVSVVGDWLVTAD